MVKSIIPSSWARNEQINHWAIMTKAVLLMLGRLVGLMPTKDLAQGQLSGATANTWQN